MTHHLAAEGRLSTEFGLVAGELKSANTHFFIGRKLDEAWKGKYQREFYRSRDFWGFTVKAHIQTAVAGLCRIFDDKKDDNRGNNLHLLRLIEKIDESQLTSEQHRQLELDLAYLQRRYPDQKKAPDSKVLRLREWRKKLIAHRDYLTTVVEFEQFLQKHRVDFDELQELIDEAFEILERWAPYHHANPILPRLARDKDDYQFVLEAVRLKVGNQG